MSSGSFHKPNRPEEKLYDDWTLLFYVSGSITCFLLLSLSTHFLESGEKTELLVREIAQEYLRVQFPNSFMVVVQVFFFDFGCHWSRRYYNQTLKTFIENFTQFSILGYRLWAINNKNHEEKYIFLYTYSHIYSSKIASSHAICIQILLHRKWILSFEFINSSSEIIKAFIQAYFAIVQYCSAHLTWKFQWGRKLYAPLDNENLVGIHCIKSLSLFPRSWVP